MQRLLRLAFFALPVFGCALGTQRARAEILLPGQAPRVAVRGGEVATLRVLSFNIRYRNKRDGFNHWNYRKAFAAGVVRFHRADVCGVQEALGVQMEQLQELLPEYASFSTGRDGDARGGERCGIFYRKDRVRCVRSATFWLSETPSRVSRAWDAALRRICTWGEFEVRATKQRFFVFNVHFDHRGKLARLESARLMRRKVAEIAGKEPAVLLGDFNCLRDSPPYRALAEARGKDAVSPLADAMDVCETAHFGPRGTFPGFGGAGRAGPKIDHVFVNRGVRVLTHGVLTPVLAAGRVVSDHWPVAADIRLERRPLQATVEIHGPFRFARDEAADGHKRGFQATDFDDRLWRKMQAGWSWEPQGVKGYDGVAWYRVGVRIPSSWKEPLAAGRVLRFVSHGIDDEFTLYVNGTEVPGGGAETRAGADRRFALRIPARLVRPGQSNSFAWRVRDIGEAGGLLGRPFFVSIDERFASRSK